MGIKLLETLCVQGLFFGTVQATWTSLGVGDCLTSSNQAPTRMERWGVDVNSCSTHCLSNAWCQGIARCGTCVNVFAGVGHCVLYVKSTGPVPKAVSGWTLKAGVRGTITKANSNAWVALYRCWIFTRTSTSTTVRTSTSSRKTTTTSIRRTTQPHPSTYTTSASIRNNSQPHPSSHTLSKAPTHPKPNMTTSQTSMATTSHAVGPSSNAMGNTTTAAATATGVINSTTKSAVTNNISTSTISAIATHVAPFMHFFGYGCCRHDTWKSPPSSRLQGKQTEQSCKDMCVTDPACIAADISSPVGDRYMCVTYYGIGQTFHTENCFLNAHQPNTSTTTMTSQAAGPSNSTNDIMSTTARQLNTSTALIGSQAVRLGNSTSNTNTTTTRQLDTSSTTAASQVVGLSNSNASRISTTTAIATGVNVTTRNETTTKIGTVTAVDKCFLKAPQLSTSTVATTSQAAGFSNRTSNNKTTTARQLDIATTTMASQAADLSNNTANNITTITSATGVSGNAANDTVTKTITTSKLPTSAAQTRANTTRSDAISTVATSTTLTRYTTMARTSSTLVDNMTMTNTALATTTRTTMTSTALATTTKTTMSPVRSTTSMRTSTTSPGPMSTIRGSFEILAPNPAFVNDPDAEQAVRMGTADAFQVPLHSTFVTLVPSSGFRRLRDLQERSRRLTTTATALYNLSVPSSKASDVAARIVSLPMVARLNTKIADAIAIVKSQAFSIQVTSIASPMIDGVAFKTQGPGASPSPGPTSGTNVIVVVIAVGCLLCCVALLTAICCGWRKLTGLLERNNVMKKPVTLPVVCVDSHDSGEGQTNNNVQSVQNEAASHERSANERSLPEEKIEANTILLGGNAGDWFVEYVSDINAEPFSLSVCTAPAFHPSSAAF